MTVGKEPLIARSSVRPSNADALVAIVVASLDNDKAEEVVGIDLRGRTPLADHMIIATGRSQRQVGAMAEHLLEKLKQAGCKVAIEGQARGDWVLIDAGDVIVHLFRPEVRAFYDLERMWVERPARRAAGR